MFSAPSSSRQQRITRIHTDGTRESLVDVVVNEMQLRIVWEEIMQRFRMVEVVGEPQRLRSSFVRGITDLPVIVHPL